MLKNVNFTRLFYGVFALLLMLGVCVALLTTGTNGGGDSVNHFMIAHFSWKHPFLFFDHWGKPVFTILSSPFAQLGMHGVKIFNVLASFGACYFIYLIIKEELPKKVLWILLIYFCAPEGVKVIFSALTEPLFACLFAAALYTLYKRMDVWSVVIASFLPLSRSEGLIVLIVFCIYFLVNHRYYLLPLALFGQFVIAALGYYVYDDILWVFNRIPYATLDSNYWSGPITHYVFAFPGTFGWVSTVLLFIGSASYLYELIRDLAKGKSIWSVVDFNFVVYGSFFAFTLSHSLFYYLGIFNDMGLTRVFIAVFPAMVIIAIHGICKVEWLIKKWAPYVLPHIWYIFTFLTLFFTYLGSGYKINFKTDFSFDQSQKLFDEQVIPFVKQNYPNHKTYFSDITFGFLTLTDVYENNNRFGREIKVKMPELKLQHHEIIIWDNWFSVVEEHIPYDTLLNNPHIRLVKSFKTKLENGTDKEVAIFESALQ